MNNIKNNVPNLSDKEKFDALMQVADHTINQFNKRREHSWKVTLSLWAALVGLTGIGEIETPKENYCWIILSIIFGLLLAGLYVFFMIKVFEADKKDKRLAFKARDIAIVMINEEKLNKQMTMFTIDKRKWYEDWSAMFQMLVTSVLIAVAVFLLIS
jgi:hypothetical protein